MLKVLHFTVGIDLLNAPGYHGVEDYDSLLEYARRLENDVEQWFPSADIEWSVDIRLGVTVRWDRVEVEAGEDDLTTVEEKVRGDLKDLADNLFESDRWVVYR
jgi:hypothetical protein